MCKILACIVFWLFIGQCLTSKDENIDADNIFKPTNEWKVIKEGQKVPAGLHYRINLATGKKEAKYITDEEQDSSKSFVVVNEESKDDTEPTGLPEVESLVKEIKDKKAENVAKKFRTLLEIKRDLGDLAITPKTDGEILQELFIKYEDEIIKKHIDEENIIEILKELSYLGNQIDNGYDFCKMNGFKKIIYKELNSTNIIIKEHALRLFSALAQNNPKVKIHILETGGLTNLLRILNLHESPLIKYSAVTALSATLRTFPYAQNSFIETGGLSVVTELMKASSIKLKLKLVTLLDDLVIERQKDTSNFEKHKLIDLEEALYKLSWCQYLNDILQDLLTVDLHDHDSIEKCMVAMKSISKKCGKLYNIKLILKLQEHYEKLNEKNDEETEDYFKYLTELSKFLLPNETQEQIFVLNEEL